MENLRHRDDKTVPGKNCRRAPMGPVTGKSQRITEFGYCPTRTAGRQMSASARWGFADR
jgi:hypothetical protein